jgi:thiol-disulfide isomerase/thioredoxin
MTHGLLALALAGQLSAAELQAHIAQERGRPVVVSFWATWCEPCRKEFPALSALAREHPDVAWISVSIDDSSDRPAVEKLLREMAPPFQVYLKAPGPDQAFIDGVDPEWSGAVPMTLVFDASGRRLALLKGEHGHAEIERALTTAARSAASDTRP